MRLKNLVSNLHLVSILSITLLIAIFSYLVLRVYHYRFDFSQGHVYSLSPQTVGILKQLKSEPIQIYAFFREDQPSKQFLEDLLREYAYHHKKFRYEFYDPDRFPAKVKQFQIEAYETIVIGAKGKREKTKQVTEEAITNCLARLLRQDVKTIAFASGYGGPPLNEEKEKVGYGLLKQKLKGSNYEVKEVTLSRGGIPEHAQVLVLAGPHVDLLPDELRVIRKYLEAGGSVLMLIDPVNSGEGKNLKEFLLGYGIELGDDVIVDKLSKLFGADYLIPVITEYKPHPITNGFRLASFFPIARSVRKAKEVPAGFEITEFAWTGAGSWAETNLKDLAEGRSDFDRNHDQLGPIPMAVALSRTNKKTHLVVFGDSDFTTNGYLNLSGNKDLILNTIAWLAGDEFAITIRPGAREATPLYLKETDQEYLFYAPVLGLPISVLFIGTCVFFWRRRFH